MLVLKLETVLDHFSRCQVSPDPLTPLLISDLINTIENEAQSLPEDFKRYVGILIRLKDDSDRDLLVNCLAELFLECYQVPSLRKSTYASSLPH
mmetsp:Transcript_7370/g.13701  ORF Transcript_7370/g.13701 Transcript_7370/m.13701 type:complete len:94 (+) Transcript_7370:732-1013(+)